MSDQIVTTTPPRPERRGSLGEVLPTFANCPILPYREEPASQAGWWWATPWPDSDWPEAGPYDTKREAEEGRSSFIRNYAGK